MGSYDIQHGLPHELVWAIRKADVLTGEFLRPISAEALSQLGGLGLASVPDEALTPCGMAIRFWLMSGSERAPGEVSRLLREHSVMVSPTAPVSAHARHRATDAAISTRGD